MRIVGFEQTNGNTPDVYTIDLWYSRRRQGWVVERLDADGNQMGAAYGCASEEDAGACLDEWLRAHNSTYLCSPQEKTAAEKRMIVHRRPRSRAA